jgi:hypothetical protein
MSNGAEINSGVESVGEVIFQKFVINKIEYLRIEEQAKSSFLYSCEMGAKSQDARLNSPINLIYLEFCERLRLL